MECLTAHHWMYELNALSLEILSLIQNDNNLQKEFRLECSGQLPDLFVQSHRIIWGYLFICFLSTCINRQEICPDCILSVKIFFPTNAFCLTTCRFFCEQFIKEQNVKWMWLCGWSYVKVSRYCSMGCLHELFWFGFGLHTLKPPELQVQTNQQNPLQTSLFFLASCWNHRKHSAFISENKKAWLTPNFLPALWHF